MTTLENRLRRDLKSLFNLNIEVEIKEDVLLLIRINFSKGENNYFKLVEVSYSYFIEKYGDVLKEIAYSIVDRLTIY